MFLQYYGGKQQLIPVLERFLPSCEMHTVISPFLGSGAFEYHLNATKGVKVTGYDNYGALVEYHNNLSAKPDALHKAILARGAHCPVDKDTYKNCHAELNNKRLTSLHRSVLLFVLHNNSYGGKGRLGELHHTRQGERYHRNASCQNQKFPSRGSRWHGRVETSARPEDSRDIHISRSSLHVQE